MDFLTGWAARWAVAEMRATHPSLSHPPKRAVLVELGVRR